MAGMIEFSPVTPSAGIAAVACVITEQLPGIAGVAPITVDVVSCARAQDAVRSLFPIQWASLKTPQIENTMVSTFFNYRIYLQKCTSEPHSIS